MLAKWQLPPEQFLSTLSLRRATWPKDLRTAHDHFYPRSPCGERHAGSLHTDHHGHISIHALLAESDAMTGTTRSAVHNFYPRSPCGERPCTGTATPVPRRFLSTLSLRRATVEMQLQEIVQQFLSTLSLRRATSCATGNGRCKPISIHALLAESDAGLYAAAGGGRDFYPRSPCGERRWRKN